ncbi:hypothetical protein C4D60_Mb04t15450 [Musa balbisiana]|uniref:Uncharacterized protein n=1 Tax=Musa balbisiana TaxID=52838 RepID=A0A4S8KC93_MUSBA|nr:hypothetical protein C4D60_Mb04t15450 [Musa balbisiana]
MERRIDYDRLIGRLLQNHHSLRYSTPNVYWWQRPHPSLLFHPSVVSRPCEANSGKKEYIYIYIYILPLPPRRIHHGGGGKPTWFEEEFELIRQEAGDKLQAPSQEEEQQQPGDGFAPRFDGLRFIETLITAHR